VVTKAGKLICLDAKINFEDNALFRHKDVAELRDVEEEDPAEVEAQVRSELREARRPDRLHGQRRGLAMATMDIIKLYGLEPANFLDVGAAPQGEVSAAFKIILSDAMNIDRVFNKVQSASTHDLIVIQ